MPHQTDPPTTPMRTETHNPYAEHSRRWESFQYVYPVISRRSRGLSIGINLNPDTLCNFDCVYCQVHKQDHPRPKEVDPVRLREELSVMLGEVASGEVWSHPGFAEIEPTLRRLNDIAFSGDGEPTTCKTFPQIVDMVTQLKNGLGLHDTKIVLITNATLLNRKPVQAALGMMDDNQGEVWAKLDAGTEPYYRRVDRSAVPFKTILDNILSCGQRRPIVIQSMFAKLHDTPPPDDEFTAYTQRIAELIKQGCQIKCIQLYTVARQPLEPYVATLPDETLSRMAESLRRHVPDTTDVVWFGSKG